MFEFLDKIEKQIEANAGNEAGLRNLVVTLETQVSDTSDRAYADGTPEWMREGLQMKVSALHDVISMLKNHLASTYDVRR
jgi:hypothetical protein